jgi:hypothetical protein
MREMTKIRVWMCYIVDMVPRRQLVAFSAVAAVVWNSRWSLFQAPVNLCKSSSTIAAVKNNVERHVAMRTM